MLNNKLGIHCAETVDKQNEFQEELKRIKAKTLLGEKSSQNI